MVEEQRKKRKRLILLLAILLAVSVCALAGILISNYIAASRAASVVIPDNIITPASEPHSVSQEQEPDSANYGGSDSGISSKNEIPDKTSTDGEKLGDTAYASAPSNNGIATSGNAERKAPVITLYQKTPEDNVPFQVENMFPGDWENKYFCVQVSHRDTVTVKFHAAVRPGYEKLAEVLKCRIILLTTGETLYDGLMRDMPASIDYRLSGADAATDTLYYEITAYLDTSVGNDYQNKELVADFNWWVEEPQNLTPPPNTGDSFQLTLWACLAAVSLFGLILLIWTKRRKEAQKNEAYQ